MIVTCWCRRRIWAHKASHILGIYNCRGNCAGAEVVTCDECNEPTLKPVVSGAYRFCSTECLDAAKEETDAP